MKLKSGRSSTGKLHLIVGRYWTLCSLPVKHMEDVSPVPGNKLTPDQKLEACGGCLNAWNAAKEYA